jgi:hypothetical protein
MDRNIVAALAFVFISVLLGMLYVFDYSLTEEPPASFDEQALTTGSEISTTTAPATAVPTADTATIPASKLATLLTQTPPLYAIESRTRLIEEIETELIKVLVSKKIEDRDLAEAMEPGRITLLAFNDSYILYDTGNPFNGIQEPVIFDVKAQQVRGKISETYLSSTKSYALYADSQYLCIYKFGFSECKVIPESELSEGEVYGDSDTFGNRLTLEEDLVINGDSITIAIYMWSTEAEQSIPTLKKVREATYTIK